MSWVKGKHNWKFGGVYRRQGFDATYNSNAAPDFGFTNVLTSAGNLANGNPSIRTPDRAPHPSFSGQHRTAQLAAVKTLLCA